MSALTPANSKQAKAYIAWRPAALICLLCMICCCVFAFSRETRFSSISNGIITIGVDKQAGGAIALLGDKAHGSIINCHDKGRYIQQSYYSGPQPFGQSSPHWPNWPWNPITAGDDYGNSGQILELKNDGESIYVKSIPKQWALNNVPGECIFETWITLRDSTAEVRQRLTNKRSDTKLYGASNQELPALYTIGRLFHLYSYCGDNPFGNENLTEIHDDGKNWAYFRGTENWAALVDDEHWGLGICHPGICNFAGGFRGSLGKGGTFDDSTGYIAPLCQEFLDHNIVYDYNYVLILGQLDEIRKIACRISSQNSMPNYHFEHDRQHWTYVNATDSGFPINGRLHVDLAQIDPQMVGPDTFWQAKDVPKLYISAAYSCGGGHGEIFVRGMHEAFSQVKSILFPIIPDGKSHQYEIDLSKVPGYSGILSSIRFDPIESGKSGDYVEVESISAIPPTEKRGNSLP